MFEPLPSVAEAAPGHFWFCRECLQENTIVIFPIDNIVLYEIADDPRRYLCSHCHIHGYMDNADAPIQITQLERQVFWKSLQTDKRFQPLRLTPEVFEALVQEGQELREAWDTATKGLCHVFLPSDTYT